MCDRRETIAAKLSWPEIETALAAGRTAILPVGAACKAHGRHLPMHTDQLQAEYFAQRLAAATEALVFPTITHGYYPAFTAYPGSLHLRAEVFREVLADTLDTLQRAGAKDILILNTGISTIAVLNEIADRYDACRLINLYAGTHLQQAEAELSTQRHGSHADEVETSIMLAIAPQQVDMQRAARCDALPFIAAPFNRTDPGADNYAPDGVYGDATLATAAKGQRFVAAIIEDLLDAS